MPREAHIVQINGKDIETWNTYTNNLKKMHSLSEDIQKRKQILQTLSDNPAEYTRISREYYSFMHDFENTYHNDYAACKAENQITDVHSLRVQAKKDEFAYLKHKTETFARKMQNAPNNPDYIREYNTWSGKLEDLKLEIKNDNILRMEIDIDDNN